MRYLALGGLLLSAAILAQSYVTSPPGYLSKMGDRDNPSWSFAYMDSQRTMQLDGEVKGTAMSIKQVSFRRSLHFSTIGYKTRTWGRVTLDLSDCDFDKASSTFSANPISTPTRVFSGSVSWQGYFGYKRTSPLVPWGEGGLHFWFSRPWVYTGKRDLCLDFAFPAWDLPRTSYAGYGLDAAIVENHGKRTFHTSMPGCFDSTQRVVATFDAHFSAFHGYGGRTHRVTMTSRNTSPFYDPVHVIGFGGIPAGIPFPGVHCNRLFVDPSKPAIFLYPEEWNTISQTRAFYRHDKNLVGFPLWFQAGWIDSKHRQLLLTNAWRILGPAMPNPTQFRRLSVHAQGVHRAKGHGPYSGQNTNPIIRYAR